MSVCDHESCTSPRPLARRKVESTGLNFAALVRAEQETFTAGLRSRIINRLLPAIQAPTAPVYESLKCENIQAYTLYCEVLRLECQHAGEGVTNETVMHALQQVEQDVGESYRHRLEHAFNIGDSALQIMARVSDVGRADIPPEFDAYCAFRWVNGWVLMNWATDCVFLYIREAVPAPDEVIEAVFSDLIQAAEMVYVVASEMYDAVLGDPDDYEE